MKIVLIFDQGLAGAGGKSNPNIGLQAVKGGVGSSLMLEPHFEKINAQILATLYCGNEYFINNEDEVISKMTVMVKKLNPDFVVCGPCFNFHDYSEMSAKISANILKNTNIHSCAMMSIENIDIINEFKDKTPIVKMPKKGGVGLNDSISNLCLLIDSSVNHPDNIKDSITKVCY